MWKWQTKILGQDSIFALMMIVDPIKTTKLYLLWSNDVPTVPTN